MANTSLNVIYTGITNKIDILSEGIKRNNLEVYSKDFDIIDSNGHFFINISKSLLIRETYIKVRDKSKKDKTWTDSIHFRIKEVPRPIAQLGTLPEGQTYHNGEVAIQNTICAYLDGFIFDGVRYKVISYRFHAFDLYNLEITTVKNKGDRAHPIKDFLNQNRQAIKIEIDSIIAVLDCKDGKTKDTLQLSPLTYFIKGAIPSNLLAECYDGKTVSMIKNSTDYNHDSSYGDIRLLKHIRGQDSITLAKRVDSAGEMLTFQRYQMDAPGRLKLSIRKISDSSYFIRYYNMHGNCVAEGKALNFQYDILKSSWNIDRTFSSCLDSLFYFMYEQRLIPFGEWHFYHEKGELLAKTYFKPIDRRKLLEVDKRKFSTICGTAALETFQRIGLWQVFDIQGKVIEEKDFGQH